MRFVYVAATTSGQMVRGDVEALTAREALRELRARGLLLQEMHPMIRRRSFRERLSVKVIRVSLLQVVLLARQLALLLRAGITVDRSFEILLGQATKRSARRVLEAVLVSIRRGESLASALSKHPNVFPQRFVAMVQWGEVGGRLSESLDHLATQLERDRDLQSKVRGAMIYPFIIVGAVVIIGGLMAFLVLPQLSQSIEEFDVVLPLPTRIFLAVAHFLADYGALSSIAVVGALVVLILLTRTGRFRPGFHWLTLRLPVVGRVIRLVNLARFNRALGSLIESGIPIINALTIVSSVLGNVWYQSVIVGVTGEVQKGHGLGKTLRAHEQLFPRIETDMISIGEETGKLSEVLLYLADFYEDSVNQTTKNLAQTIEPLLLLVVGAIVAGVVLAVMLPIYAISQAIV